jgi:protein-L-isoaspartate(D-aspartate) O-methyltransferase
LLQNSEPGRPAHIFQGFPIDGRAVREVTISYYVRVLRVGKGRLSETKPGVAIRFFDERRVRSTRLVAPLRTISNQWQRVTSSILVPIWSREAILQIGLMGATGQIEVDQVEIMAADRS